MHDDDTAPAVIGRRSLLKRAGAVGAVSVAAPITFDSFLSPAAAVSGDDIAVHLLTTWADDVDTLLTAQSSYTSSSVAPVVDDGRIFVVVNLYYRDDGGITAAGSAPNILVTDSVGSTWTLHGLRHYTSTFNPGNRANAGSRLAVFSAPVTSTAARTITVHANDSNQGILDPNGDHWNFMGHVVHLVPPNGFALNVVQATTAVNAPATPASVTATLSAPESSNGQLLVFGSAGPILNSTSGGGPPVWPTLAQFTEIADTFWNDTTATFANDNNDHSLQTNWGMVAQPSVSNTQSGAAPNNSAAIAIEIGLV